MHLIPKKYGAKLQSADSISYYYVVLCKYLRIYVLLCKSAAGLKTVEYAGA